MVEKTFDRAGYLPWKRLLDIVGASAAIVLLAVPMLLIMLILKLLYPRSPVLFRQKRVGRDGELFTLVKFASMRNVPGGQGGECVTGFGHFLRSASLDELPQLFQVLSGKMSLIGPRPLIPQEKEIHIMRQKAGVYRLRPGITGWAQVNGRRKLSDEKKAAFDREYLEKMSFSMDVRILRMTIGQVLRREGVDQ